MLRGCGGIFANEIQSHDQKVPKSIPVMSTSPRGGGTFNIAEVTWENRYRGTKEGRDFDGIKMGTESSSTSRPLADLVGLMQALKLVAKLHQEISNTQIAFREKRREASFKREVVSECDARFMRKVQKLIASGESQQFQELAHDCQTARDALGPVEEEGIIAEQQLEGQIWSLREAEKKLYDEFEYEFQTASRYPSPESVDSSEYQLPSDPYDYGDQLNSDAGRNEKTNLSPEYPECANFPTSSAGVEPEIGRAKEAAHSVPAPPSLQEDSESEAWNSDSGMTGIDWEGDQGGTGILEGYIQKSPRRHYKSDLYVNLLTNFGSKRDRINKWLEKNALESRVEATSIFNILGEELGLESQEMPSNWSQLVIAYWEFDGAAVSHLEERCPENQCEEGSQ